MRSRRHVGGSFSLARVFALVVALHFAVGGALLWIAKTQTGQEFAREYNLRFFEPPKPPEVAKEEPPPPPPPPLPPLEAPKAPVVAAPAAAAAVAAAAPAPSIGGGSPGTSWSGKFAGDSFDGPDGAFHAGVVGRFRKYYSEPSESFGPAELEITVTASGGVRAFRLIKSSGNSSNDQAILAAAAHIQSEGLAAPPGGVARIVTVRFVPSS